MYQKSLFILLFLISCICYSQEENDLKIFLDCRVCDNTYIRQNLEHVEFVRDQNFADVHVFFTTQRTGSGGREYVIDFIGMNNYQDQLNTLKFATDVDMTRDDVRVLILKKIQIGLISYWVNLGKDDIVEVTIKSAEKEEVLEEEEEKKDPWNYWFIELGQMDGLMGRKPVNLATLTPIYLQNE